MPTQRKSAPLVKRDHLPASVSVPKTAADLRVAPWQRTDCIEFLELVAAPRDRSGALSNEPILTKRWKAVRAHPVYRQLIENESFRLAQRTFRKDILWKLTDPWAHFEFLWIFVCLAGVYSDAEAEGYLPKLSSIKKRKIARDRKRPLAIAAKLFDALKKAGAGLESAPATGELKDLLPSFIEQLSEPKPSGDMGMKRKRHDRGDRRAKTVTRMFARLLFAEVGADPTVPKIVASWAEMVNCGLHPKAVTRLVEGAEQEWRAMAKGGAQWPTVQGAKI